MYRNNNKKYLKANPCSAKREFYTFECMSKAGFDVDMQNEWSVQKRN